MAIPGDPVAHPNETSAVDSVTCAMNDELSHMSTHIVVAWLGRNRPMVDTKIIKKAICYTLAVRSLDVSVTKHYPVDFFIDFKHYHHRDEAVALEKLPYGNLNIHINPWQLLTHGDNCNFSTTSAMLGKNSLTRLELVYCEASSGNITQAQLC